MTDCHRNRHAVASIAGRLLVGKVSKLTRPE